MTYGLGLDFGTTFTAAAVERDGVVKVATLGNRAGAVPAAVFVRADGTLLHGEDAFMRGASEPLGLIRNLKRRLGDSTAIEVEGRRLVTAELVADHLRWAVDRVAEQEGGPPERLVITHPASWRSSRLAGLRAAIDLAGLDYTFATEPHAAAAFHAESHPVEVGDLLAAYDLGGGTFDAAVLRRSPTGFELAGEPEGEDRLGGVDFDDVIFRLLQSRLGDRWQAASNAGGSGAFEVSVAALRRECVTAKESLSTEESVEIPVLLPGLMTSVTVTRTDLEHLIRSSIDDTIGTFRRALAGAGVQASDLSAVLLVGGSCRLPIVRSSVAAAVGDGVVLLDADPKHAVARGAAILAGRLRSETAAAAAPPSPPPTLLFPPPAVPAAPFAEPAPVPAAPVRPTAPVATPSSVPLADAPMPSPSWSRPSAEPERSRRGAGAGRTRVAVLVGAALLLAAVPAVWFFTRDDDAPSANETVAQGDTPGEVTTDEVTVPVVDEPRSASPDDMVEVPAGTYAVGVATPSAESAAATTVTLEPFHIDVFEATHAQYLTFVQQIGAPPPLTWERGEMPAELADHPVTGVEYVWAEAYCEALGKRLPTEAEWEAAARGPEGTLYPAGDTEDGLDLERSGSRPVGSTPANVSAFGVHDTVGSVWEWVGEPYVPVDAGIQVRRGGQYGRVRDGSAMRQAVDPNGQATITETGFRCAADRVDPSVTAFEFTIDHALPAEQDDHADHIETQDVDADGSLVLVDDSFEDTESGFATEEVGAWRVGYHAPSWYHLEAAGPNTQVVSLGGYNLADGDIELAVSIDKTATTTGFYRYGLVFRSGDTTEPPPAGIIGPDRPEVYYAFVINPRAGIWELLHEDELPQRAQATGELPAVRVTDPAAPDVLGLSMRGSTVDLFINGELVFVFDTRGFHVDAGNVGLYAETYDETLVHVHFDRLTITQS